MRLSNLLPSRFTIGIVALCGLLVGLTNGDKKTLKISTIEREPYLKYFSWRNGNERFEGFVPDLLKALCKENAFSCDYEIHLVEDGSYGNKYGETWNGIMGEVLSRKADLGLPIMATDARKMAVDFSDPIANNSLTVLVKDGWDIENREDLLRRTYDSWLKFGTLKSGWTRKAFTMATDDHGRNMNEKMTVFAKNITDGIKKTLNGNYSFIGSRDDLEYYSNHYCGLAIKDDFYPAEPNGIIMRKDSGLLEKVNQALRKLKQNGKFAKMRKEHWYPDECTDSAVTTHASIYLSLLLFTIGALFNY